MMGNTFGRLFRITTCGESYAGAFRNEENLPENLKGGLMTIIDGVPSGIKFTQEMLEAELEKRRPGMNDLSTPRAERDRGYILSGVMENDMTTGAPIGIYIPNSDILPDQIEKHRQKRDILRPGQATYTFIKKYGEHYDYLGAGRSSGRETVSRVAGGAVAKAILDKAGIDVVAYISAIGGITSKEVDYATAKANYRKNDINCPDLEAGDLMIEKIKKVKEAGNTVGGIVEIIVKGLPAGIGEPVFDKLEAVISHALMSIGAIKGIEFGKGFEHALMTGDISNDIPYISEGSGELCFKTNNAGGILGGISTGEEIRIRVAVKPTPTLAMPEDTVDINKMENLNTVFSTRNDPTICARIYGVCEAMTRIAILDSLYMSLGYEKVISIMKNS